MSLLQAVLLAVVQGFTEFLPISSSAHLALAPWLLGWPDQGLTFDIALHLGTLAAVCAYFFRDWLQIAAQALALGFQPDPELRRRPALLWLLAGATVPVAIVGFLLKDYVETALRSPYVIGFMMVAVGLLMGWADRVGRRSKALGDITVGDGVAIGLAQALAVIPGTSRSGITIVAGLFRGIDREAAARFSFLLSTPAIGGAALKAFLDLMERGGVPEGMMIPFAAGMATSAVTGCLVIRFFLRYLRHHSLSFFVAYRIIFGIIVLALAYFRLPAG